MLNCRLGRTRIAVAHPLCSDAERDMPSEIVLELKRSISYDVHAACIQYSQHSADVLVVRVGYLIRKAIGQLGPSTRESANDAMAAQLTVVLNF